MGGKRVDAVSRIIVGAYLGALLAGPSPFGFAGPFIYENWNLVGTLALAMVLIVPWLMAGGFAGRLRGLSAVLVGYLYWQWGFLYGAMAGPMAVGLVLSLLSAWLGSWLFSRLKMALILDGWRHWRAAAITALVLAVYTLVLGPTVALHTTRARFKKADSTLLHTYPSGSYVAVEGILRCPDCGHFHTYYTDPSGLFFLYKTSLD